MRRAGIRRLPGSYECFEQIVCSFKRGRRTRLAATRTLIVNSPRLGEQLTTMSVVVTPQLVDLLLQSKVRVGSPANLALAFGEGNSHGN